MADEWIIETEGLGRRYGSRWVVEDLSLRIPRGAVYGFLGLNGAGKSTTIRMLMGLIRRHAGQARVLGFDPAKQDVEIKRRVGYVAEQPAFYDWMRVDEICGFVAHYRRGQWDSRRAEDLIKRFRVPTDARLRDLSKGQRAKTALVLAMAFNPDVLILDEPTSGLDPVARREFVEGVLAEFQESGRTIFVSSHLVNELAGLVDHVGILFEGQLLVSQRAEEFLDSMRRIRLAFDGEAPREIQCPGLLKAQVDGREAVLAVRNYIEEQTTAPLRALKPVSLEVERLNLEDAFVEFVGAAEREQA
ncbi:MAG: ABC transporter ATP-binding protein [Candidatus Sumerlaeota bacterium]|nr:ABC transporter ATP-binding protein [Candidatus Sumerlaeota bacterium]